MPVYTPPFPVKLFLPFNETVPAGFHALVEYFLRALACPGAVSRGLHGFPEALHCGTRGLCLAWRIDRRGRHLLVVEIAGYHLAVKLILLEAFRGRSGFRPYIFFRRRAPERTQKCHENDHNFFHPHFHATFPLSPY